MKNANKLVAIIVVSTTILYACKKTENTKAVLTNTTLGNLVSGKWKITSIRVNTPYGTEEISDTMPECRKDNLATFKLSGKIYSDEGATKCNSSALQVDSSGTWSLNSDNSKLTANVSWVPTSNKTFNVLEVSSTTIRLAQSFDTTFTYSGFPLVVTIKDTITAVNVN